MFYIFFFFRGSCHFQTPRTLYICIVVIYFLSFFFLKEFAESMDFTIPCIVRIVVFIYIYICVRSFLFIRGVNFFSPPHTTVHTIRNRGRVPFSRVSNESQSIRTTLSRRKVVATIYIYT